MTNVPVQGETQTQPKWHTCVFFYCTYPYDVAFVVGEGLQRLHCVGLYHYHDALAAVSYQTLPTPAVHTGRSEKFAKLSQAISTYQSNAALLSTCGSPGNTRVRRTGILVDANVEEKETPRREACDKVQYNFSHVLQFLT